MNKLNHKYQLYPS